MINIGLHKRVVLLLMLIMSLQSVAFVQLTQAASVDMSAPEHHGSMVDVAAHNPCMEHCEHPLRAAADVCADHGVDMSACSGGHCPMQACVSVVPGINQSLVMLALVPERIFLLPFSENPPSRVSPPQLRPPIVLI